MPDLKLVIFDVDGTLVDSQAEIVAAMEISFGAVNQPLPTRDTLLSVVGLSLVECFTILLPNSDASVRSMAVEAYKQGYHDNRVAGARPVLFDGMADLLDKLEQDDHILLGLATGKSRRGLDALFGFYGWENRFVTTQVSDNHPSKPHPSMILTAMSETGVDAARTVMIGDTTYDIEMARAAGVNAIGVDWGYHPKSALLHANAVVSRPDALYSAVHTILG